MNIAIPIGFLILATILLWFFIGTKGKLAIKIALILISSYYCLVTWHSLESYAGWPANAHPPEEFILHWVVVSEPNKVTKDPGAIYVWLTGDTNEPSTLLNLFKHASDKTEPRAYTIPYSTALHEQAQKARGLLMKGKVVKGGKKKGSGMPGDGAAGAGDGLSGGGKRGGSLSNEQEYEFHELLPSVLPDKYPHDDQ